MQNVDIWEWDTPLVHAIAPFFLFISLFLLCISCVLGIIFCRRSNEKAPKTSPLPAPSQESCRQNYAFDLSETSPSRIEERRCQRQARLTCDNPKADVTLEGIDRSVGKALAVEKLLQDSYIFDTRLMGRPNGNILIVAAKRDYI